MLFYSLIGTLILVVFAGNVSSSVKGYIDHADTQKFVTILYKLLSDGDSNLTGIYQGAVGHKLLNVKIDSQLTKRNCDILRTKFKGDEDPEIIFQVYSAWLHLACPNKIHKEETVKYLRNTVVNEKSSTADIRFASEALKVIGESLPNPNKIAQLLLSKLKEDDNLQTVGHAIHASLLLGTHGKFALDRIEDVVVQLDEVNGKLLQWEGGLSTTSLLLTGLLNIQGVNPLTQIQADKISNYLLSRKSVQTGKGIVALLEAIKVLTSSTVSPISIGIIGKSSVNIKKAELKFRVSNLLGAPIKPLPGPVVALSATRVVDDVVVLSKEPLTSGSGPTEFVLPLHLNPDYYQVVLNTGNNTESFHVRVLGPVNIESFELGLSDLDGTGVPHFTKLEYPNSLIHPLSADSIHSLIARFSLSRSIHQTFLRLRSINKEITFIAEQDNNKVYKIEINLNSEFTFSGTFDMELILGDPVMSNPITWNLGKIELNLGKVDPERKGFEGPKPEIEHLFRQAEKRPSTTVSLLFSILTAAPLVFLLILWFKVGINVKRFSVMALPFHVGFGSILILFLCFWLKMDMFTTCAWLIPLGTFTFLSGHKVLSTTK